MTITEDAPAGHVGSRRLRKEDPALLTGEAKFIDDLALPGAIWVGVVRSTEAHANIVGIDGSAALEIDGVNEVLSGEDLAPLWGEGALPCAWPVTPDMKNPAHLPVARGTAKYVGDAVAVVLADSRYAAADGAAAVVVDYEPLPAVVEIEDAVADGAPLVHADLESNECYTWGLWGDNAPAIEAAFAEAAHVVSERYLQQRLIPAPMEPRGCAAVPSPAGGELTLYSATQIPHILKVMTAVVLGI
ncbi:MAG: xanthine dehydrogenase family protein molybdopterin-binding subunit, partial [Acidimicrobiaceae bacterium]|nr:xanthine dehydrogenase family protein molybdopterin-binding subunit [Acidimicrobiaceae bacterium]